MEKFVIDTDIYIDLVNTGRFSDELEELYFKHTPRIYFSAVVSQELLTGAHTTRDRKLVNQLISPFEKVNRVVVPNHHHWKKLLAFTHSFHLYSFLESLLNSACTF
jgi:predicted nucleic acid-binding protein